MTTTNDAYINALLADATYVRFAYWPQGDNLAQALRQRMTNPLAAYIANNFDVLT
jgi:hypothetical protein